MFGTEIHISVGRVTCGSVSFAVRLCVCLCVFVSKAELINDLNISLLFFPSGHYFFMYSRDVDIHLRIGTCINLTHARTHTSIPASTHARTKSRPAHPKYAQHRIKSYNRCVPCTKMLISHYLRSYRLNCGFDSEVISKT